MTKALSPSFQDVIRGRRPHWPRIFGLVVAPLTLWALIILWLTS